MECAVWMDPDMVGNDGLRFDGLMTDEGDECEVSP